MKKFLLFVFAVSIAICSTYGQNKNQLSTNEDILLPKVDEHLNFKKIKDQPYKKVQSLKDVIIKDNFQEQNQNRHPELDEVINLSKPKLDITANAAKGAVSESDSLALVALYNSTNGDEWTDNTNWLTGPVDTWFGVTVFGSTIASIDLGDNNLNGTIPADIGTLVDLQMLYLHRNNLTGSIPAEIGNLTSLVALYLYENELSGEIPTEIGNLTLMQYMFFHYNNLTGSLPSSMGNLTSLLHLGIYKNQLTGSLPTSLGNCASLEYLDLRYNQLSGIIPNELGSLTNMTTLYLSYNELSGAIPSTLNNLTKLQYLIINDNKLTDLPDLSALTSLVYFIVEENIFTFGDLDNTGINISGLAIASFSPQASIDQPSVVDNGNGTSTFTCTTDGTGNTYQWYKDDVALAGETTTTLTVANADAGVYYCLVTNTNYPELILDTKALFFNTTSHHGLLEDEYNILVNIFNNNNGINWNDNTNWLSEEDVDTWYGITARRGHVTEINLDDNNLTGNILSDIGSLLELTDLCLSNNSLTGSIPAELGNLSELFHLYLEYNQLTGTIPSQLGNLSRLGFLRLYNNHLTGAIPSEFGNLENLVGLYIHNNQLSGTIPSELNNLPLQILYIYNNQFVNLTDLSATNISTFYPFDNEFEFDDLENSGIDYSSITTIYHPQARLTKPSKTDNGDGTTTLTVTTPGTGNTYQWYSKDGIMTGETSNTVDVDNATETYYYCQISNPTYPELTLETDYVGMNITLSHGIIEAEYNALVELYNSTNGDDWTDNTNWLSDEYVEEWFGVAVSDIHITELNLATNNLIGSLPTEIGNLELLESLSIDHNEITGEIPSEIGNLVELQELSIWENQFSGEIPSEIGNLTKLTTLDIGYNELSGEIPSSISNLTNLDELWLNDNLLSGTIPSGIGNLVQLKKLCLANNRLTGAIPSSIGNLTLLENLYLNKNLLSEALPTELGNLTKLTYLDLSYNKISGSIPTELGNLTNLNYFLLYKNDFSGTIPTELGNLTKLYYLYIYDNQLTGTIPAEIGNIPFLMFIAFNNNQLTGAIPAEIGNLNYLDKLYLFNNSFTDLADLSTTSISTLSIRENNFDFSDLEATGLNFGSLTSVSYSPQAKLDKPAMVDNGNGTTTLTVTTTGTGDAYQWYKNGVEMAGETSNTITVDNTAESFYYCMITNTNYPNLVLETEYAEFNISASHGVDKAEYEALISFYNSTNGDYWTDNTNWASDANVQTWYGVTVVDAHVTGLNLATNNLTGNLTSDIGALDSLISLNIDHNKIEGTIPTEIGNLVKLQELNMWENEMTGGIPGELGNLVNLQTLDIGFNKFTGTIPAEIGNLTELQDLWLNDNQLTGNIPTEIGNLTNATTIGFSNNQLTGAVPSSIGNLTNLTYLSFADNIINGELPAEIGNLTNLQYLYLNNNQITGSIPVELGLLTNLQYLYLYNNQLTGAIPAELGNLNSLIALYLQLNQLSGTIPAELGNLNAYAINLRDNQLSGTIPAELGNIANLQSLYLYNNQLTGTIPTALGNLSNLRVLSLKYNYLEGDIPTELANLTNIQELYLSNNNLSGTIDLSGLANLVAVFVNNNVFTFGDLETINLTPGSITYDYAPQSELPEPTQTPSGDDIILSFTTDGTGNTYQWYKDSEVLTGETSNSLTIANTDGGIYHCEVTNSNYDELTLTTKAAFVNSTGTNGITEDEYNALVEFYNSTNGGNWSNNTNWLSEEDASTWFGVSVEGGHVIGLEFVRNRITGTIPADIQDLTYLENLTIYENGEGLTGQIPTEIGNLENLSYLNLYFNSLSGQVPSNIGNLSNLEYLNLNYNDLEGAIPTELGNLLNLQSLYLYDNNLSGEIPASIGDLDNLVILSLAYNELTGEVPSEIGNLTNLEELYLHHSTLSGELPAELGNLVNLRVFDINNNVFTGIPDLSSLTNLNTFNINDNNFVFADFEDSNLDFSAITNVSYAPQENLAMNDSYKYLMEGSELTLSCDEMTNELLSGTDNLYAVYKDGSIVKAWSSDPDYVISSLSSSHEGEYTIQVKSSVYTDLILYSDALTIGINSSPTDIAINSSSIAENSSIGSVVGQFSSTDENEGDSFTYTLIAGDGSNDADNNNFTIDGNNLKSAVEFDFEAKTEYHIYIETEDANGLTFEKSFVITVSNINEVPTNITITNVTIDENTSIGTIVGQLSSEDEDAGETFTYTLITGNGTNDADNASFTIEGNDLKTAGEINFEDQSELNIYIQVEDAGGLTYNKEFSVSVTDLNDAPTDISISNITIDENTSVGTIVGQLTTEDEDASDSFTYTLVVGNGTNDADNASFNISGDNLQSAIEFDYELKTEYHINIQSEDADGLSFEKSFVININDITETGIVDLDKSECSVYPNPTKGIFTLEINHENSEVKIYDVVGNIIYDEITTSQKTEIDLSDSDAGFYFVIVQNGNQRITKKLQVL